jgi:Golgi-body localisation protein domain
VVGGASSLGIQLQRIVSRCKAEFFYVSYGDTALEDVGETAGGCYYKLSGASPVEDDWNETQTAVNAFSLVHHDLNVCTNSLQYAMVLDIINNLLLYSEPAIKVRKRTYQIQSTSNCLSQWAPFGLDQEPAL